MTKQQKIREGMARRLHTQERTLLRVVKEISPCNCMWEDLDRHFKKQYRETARIFTVYLHSQGVVIKAERGASLHSPEAKGNTLPDNKAWHKVEREFEAYCAGRNDMINAGYVAVESLIKGD